MLGKRYCRLLEPGTIGLEQVIAVQQVNLDLLLIFYVLINLPNIPKIKLAYSGNGKAR